MSQLLFLSARYWRRRAGRGAVTVFGVALGVALLVAVGLINDSILRGYERLAEALAGRAHLEVRALHPQGMDVEWLERVREGAGVEAAVPVLERRSFLFYEERRVPLRVRGVDPARDRLVRPVDLDAGRPLQEDDAAVLLLASPLATALGAQVGDTVELLTPEGFAPFRIVGTFGGPLPLDAPQSRIAVAPLASLQASYQGGAPTVSQIDVVLAPAADPVAAAERLADLVRGVGFVQRPLEDAARVAELTRGVRFTLLLASVMSLVAAAYLIANNALAAVAERQRELATLRALGLRRRTVVAWLMAEVLALASLGGLLGVLLGSVAAVTLTGVVSGRLVLPFRLAVGAQAPALPVLAAGFAVGVAAALLAAFPAVRWISRRDLASALGGRRDLLLAAPEGPARTPRWLLPVGLGSSLAGGALLQLLAPSLAWGALGVFLVLVTLLGVAAYLPVLMATLGQSLHTLPSSPLWLRLAADSLRRHRRRTGAVAASLMITLAILVGVFGAVRSYRQGVAAWVDGMFGWDLRVSSAAQGLRAGVPLAEDLGPALETVPGVRNAMAERVVLAALGSRAVTLHAWDPRRLDGLALEGGDGAPLRASLEGRSRVAVTSELARARGLRTGSVVELGAPGGPLLFEVAAVVRDRAEVGGAVYLDRAVYAEGWRDRTVDSFAVRLEPDADPATVAGAIERTFARRYPLQVDSAATFKEEVDRMVRETFGLSQGLVLTAVLVALFGLMNAGALGAWQMRSQMAVLRALGAPTGLLSRALLAEAWLTGAIGGLVGAVMGTLLSGVLLRAVQEASTLAIAWTWPHGAYLVAAAVALVGSLAVAWLPSRQAGRGSLAEGLRADGSSG